MVLTVTGFAFGKHCVMKNFSISSRNKKTFNLTTRAYDVTVHMM